MSEIEKSFWSVAIYKRDYNRLKKLKEKYSLSYCQILEIMTDVLEKNEEVILSANFKAIS